MFGAIIEALKDPRKSHDGKSERLKMDDLDQHLRKFGCYQVSWRFSADSKGNYEVSMGDHHERSKFLDVEVSILMYLTYRDSTELITIMNNDGGVTSFDSSQWGTESTPFSSRRRYCLKEYQKFDGKFYHGNMDPFDVACDAADAAILAWVKENFTIAE